MIKNSINISIWEIFRLQTTRRLHQKHSDVLKPQNLVTPKNDKRHGIEFELNKIEWITTLNKCANKSVNIFISNLNFSLMIEFYSWWRMHTRAHTHVCRRCSLKSLTNAALVQNATFNSVPLARPPIRTSATLRSEFTAENANNCNWQRCKKLNDINLGINEHEKGASLHSFAARVDGLCH